MKTITYKQLKRLGACKNQLSLFKETFGDSVSFSSLEEAKELASKYALEFDFYWLGSRLFMEAYDEAKATLWEDYLEAEATLWEDYMKSGDPLWEDYRKAKAALWEDYKKAVDLLWEAYEKAVAPLFAEMYWNLGGDDPSEM